MVELLKRFSKDKPYKAIGVTYVGSQATYEKKLKEF